MVSMHFCYLIRIGDTFDFGMTQSPKALLEGIKKEKAIEDIQVVALTIMPFNECRKAIRFMKKMRLSDFQYWAKQSTRLVARWINSAGGIKDSTFGDCISHLR